jgi:hypothetical protein
MPLAFRLRFTQRQQLKMFRVSDLLISGHCEKSVSCKGASCYMGIARDQYTPKRNSTAIMRERVPTSGHNTVCSDESQPTLRRNISLPLSGSKSMSCKKLTRRRNVCYIYIPHKNYIYICYPQTQLNFFTLPKFHYMFRPLRAIFRWYFLKISYSTATHPSSLQVWGYLLLLNLYVYNAKEVFKIHNFYIGLHKMHIIFFA